MRILALALGAGLVVGAAGCATMKEKKEERSAAVSAQESAAKQLEIAVEAQRRAQDEQAKAEALDKDIEKAQKQVAELQAKARGQHAKAEAAQREAERLL